MDEKDYKAMNKQEDSHALLGSVSERFFPCECHSEGVLLTRFEDDPYKEIYLAIFSFGQFNPKPSIIDRIKYAWYHLRTGKKYSDQIILDFDKAIDIGEWLIKNAH